LFQGVNSLNIDVMLWWESFTTM